MVEMKKKKIVIALAEFFFFHLYNEENIKEGMLNRK